MSITRITYLDQFYTSGIFTIYDPLVNILHFQDNLELTEFLSELEADKNYVVTFNLIQPEMDGDDENPSITLSKPILITKNSNPKLISDFLEDKIQLACNSFYLDESLFEIEDKGLVVIVRYNEINIF